MSWRSLALAGFMAGTLAMTASMRATTPGEEKDSTAVTFNKDVLPVLQKNCQSCHRPGEIAPMSFLTYKDARPWAKAIKAAVVSRKMPPWFADPKYGHFANDRTLSDSTISTLVAWADNGALEGDAKDAPPPVTFVDGWSFKPDMIIEMPKDIPLPATGTINYKSILVKVNFPEDLWVVAADLRPGNAAAVHHMRAIVRPPGSTWMKDAEPGVAYEGGDPEVGRQGEGTDLLGKFNPGLGGQDFSMFDSAKFVPKGSDIVFSMHYTATGKATTDRSKLGLVFAKKAPKLKYYVSDGPTASNLAIPAGDSNAEVVSEMTAQADTQLVYLQPHMHLRGKDYEVRLISPSGESKTIFKAKWDFNWQLGFDLEKPLPIAKGTRIVGIAHFDNSANNKYNPDPAKLVVWGPQNWEEMQNCFMGFLVDPNLKNPRTLFRATGPSLLPRGTSGPTLSTLVSN
ncbi:MAG: thiol-disulfide isomerase [Acidobacteria bacterium]|nr:MAG: thiol-disulfide isomerase [Acidobacteriota bacterium]